MKTQSKILPFFCAALIKLNPAAINSPDEWIRYSESQIRGESSQSDMKLDIITPQWKRSMEMTAKVQGKDKSLAMIESPAKEKGTGTLRLEQKMWNYLSKVKRTVEVAPSMLLSSWMGSDFSNDDILKASSMIEDYSHKFAPDEKIKDETYKVVESTSKSNAKVLWPKIMVYLSQKDCLPRVQKYYDKDGAVIRTLTLDNVKSFGKHTLPTLWTMKTEKEKDKQTTLEYVKIEYDVKFKEDVFTIKGLTQ